MAKLNQIQQTYITAREAAKAAHKAADAELQPHYHLLETDEGIDDFVDIEMEVNKKYDISFLDNVKMTTEKALLNWSFEAVKKTSEYRNNPETRSNIDAVISKAFMPTIRPKLIETALRLNPNA